MEPCCAKFGGQTLSDHSRVLWWAFFDSEGDIIHKDLIPTDVRLEDTIQSLEGDDKRLFLHFIKDMLQWLPEDRKAARNFLKIRGCKGNVL